MRARKRNPYRGQGLDKRQARRARRRAARVEHFIESLPLDQWQRAVVHQVFATPRTHGQSPLPAHPHVQTLLQHYGEALVGVWDQNGRLLAVGFDGGRP